MAALPRNFKPPVLDADKLPILTNAAGKVENIKKVSTNAKIWAFQKCLNPLAKKILVNGVTVLIDNGMICTADGAPDGNWIFKSSPETCPGIDMKCIDALISKEDMNICAYLIIANKADFWCSEPTILRQIFLTERVKATAVKFYNPDDINDDVIRAINMIGDFCSTLRVLWISNIDNIRKATPCIRRIGAFVAYPDEQKRDYFKWFSSLPAGTKLLQLCYPIACLLISHKLINDCPRPREIKAIPSIRQKILRNRTSYHTHAVYLTGKPRAYYDDAYCQNWMGRIGTFVRELMTHSSIAKSPYFSEDNIILYLDYDPQWKLKLETYVSERTKK